MKKAVKILLILAILCGLGYFVYLHRRVIRAWLDGTELPEVPVGHHSFCYKS